MSATSIHRAMTFSGISQGLSQGYQNTFSTEGRARRAELNTLKEQREQELRRLQVTEPTEQDYERQNELQRQQVETAISQLQEQQNMNVQQQVYRGFDRWTADHDIRHLNTMLNDVKQSGEIGSRLMGDTVRLDAITEQDRDWLTRQGVDADLVLQNPELQQSFVKATLANGKQVLSDVNTFMQMSGYDRYADDRELERQMKAVSIASAFQSTGARTELERQANRMAAQQGLEPGSQDYDNFVTNYIQQERDRTQQPRLNSERERAADRIARQQGFEPGTREYDQAFNEAYGEARASDRQTAASRNLDEVEQARERINQRAQELDSDFFSLDMNQRENRIQFADDINRIARLGDLDLSASERSELSNVRRLIALGEPAGELTEAETGLIDNTLVSLRRYLTNNTQGLDSTSAYHAFRNTMRHALHGAQLSQHEMRSMNQQFGTLGQQLGPVLTQFRTSALELRSRLETLFNTNDPYVMHYYAGVDEEQLADIITALDDRIQYIGSQSTGGAPDVMIPTNQSRPPRATEDGLDPNTRQTLDDLWRQTQGGGQ